MRLQPPFLRLPPIPKISHAPLPARPAPTRARESLGQAGDAVQPLFIMIDPARDTTKRLAPGTSAARIAEVIRPNL